MLVLLFSLPKQWFAQDSKNKIIWGLFLTLVLLVVSGGLLFGSDVSLMAQIFGGVVVLLVGILLVVKWIFSKIGRLQQEKDQLEAEIANLQPKVEFLYREKQRLEHEIKTGH